MLVAPQGAAPPISYREPSGDRVEAESQAQPRPEPRDELPDPQISIQAQPTQEAEATSFEAISAWRVFEGPMPELANRLWSRESSEQVDLLDVFCGADRPGDLRDATNGAGGSSLGVWTSR